MGSSVFEIPKVGQMVTVRNRPAVVRNVHMFSLPNSGTSHAVEVEYLDGWSHPQRNLLIWEREVGARVIKGNLLPKIDDYGCPPDHPESLQVFLDAFRWSSVHRLTEEMEQQEEEIKLIAPWQSAVQIEDYQLYPVLKALTMPRISLLLADDVGLGKTIEAGLIISEMIARNRIKRVLVICPASLQTQWKEELKEKFYLDFEIVDREKTFKLQRTLGIDSNPWAVFPRIITSMDYLRQRDVLESFFSACKMIAGNNEAVLPWQMLVVDEAHNLAPSGYGENSERYKMLRSISPNFEHRLFLTATPHNGYTHSFTGLLELMDPVRFKQTTAMDEEDRRQIERVMIRRLKSELNAQNRGRFAARHVESLEVPIRGEEKKLFDALRSYRNAGIELLKGRDKKEKHLGEFLFMLLTKRLLSSSYAFACTWWQHVAGLDIDPPQLDEVDYARKRAESPVNDDEEKEQREADAVRKGGAWLNRYAEELKPEMDRVSEQLNKMGLDAEAIRNGVERMQVFPPDAKFERLEKWIDQMLIVERKMKRDERLIIFTEYKQTLDYLYQRLKQRGFDQPLLATLFGGISPERRQEIKRAFNDPDSPLRILLATDTAAEGINLQTSCRYMIHQDIPWNPMRLEQRNGRVDRHGQYRDVFIYHFSSRDEADMEFLSRVVKKVEQAREDLGSVGQVLDQAVVQHFTGQKLDDRQLTVWIENMKKESTGKKDLEVYRNRRWNYSRSLQRLRATELSLGLKDESLARLLNFALRMENGSLREISPGVYRIDKIPPAWERIVKETIEIKKGALQGSLPKLVFNPAYFEREINGRKMFQPRPDTVLIRLGHPLMQRALSTIKRSLWDSFQMQRWTVEGTSLPAGVEQILLLHLLLEGTNKLRETIHQEVVEVPFQVVGEQLIPLEESLWNEIKRMPRYALESNDLSRWTRTIREQWLDHEPQIKEYIAQRSEAERQMFEQRLAIYLKRAKEDEKSQFDRRMAELRKSSQEREQMRIRKQIEEQYARLRQGFLFAEYEAEEKQKLRELETQLGLIQENTEYMKRILEREKERVLKRVLPKKYALGHFEIYPLAVEYLVQHG